MSKNAVDTDKNNNNKSGDENIIIAIDPGKSKAGIAVYKSKVGPLYLNIVENTGIIPKLKEYIKEYPSAQIILGDGTFGKETAKTLKIAKLEFVFVDEKNSTLEARKRYFQINPPKGLWAFMPKGLLFTNRPLDDYAALVLAEKYITADN